MEAKAVWFFGQSWRQYSQLPTSYGCYYSNRSIYDSSDALRINMAAASVC